MSSAKGGLTDAGNYQVCQVAADLDLQALMRARPQRYPYLLQSAALAHDIARYDILFAFPGTQLILDSDFELGGREVSDPAAGFLGALDEWWESESLPDEQNGSAPLANLPFTGGWFLYLGYELAGEIEPGLRLQTCPDMPVAFATRIPAAIIIDRQEKLGYLLAEVGNTSLIKEMQADINALDEFRNQPVTVLSITEPPASEFVAAVRQAQKAIADGAIYQANLSRNWQAELAADSQPLDLYRELCTTNPAPFAGLLLQDDFAIICSSPERLVRKQGRRIDTRPIAGTRPRNESPEHTDALKQELLAHPKDRAEHIMLIDLERNDLGRVCAGGSVHVDEYMVVESYSHVHHIVSNVTGMAREGLTPGELIHAVFPGGTITGCPKVRCMEIIQQLEDRPRGAYTGSMGFLNRNGDLDLNILIRTITQHNGQVDLAAGSGIVADSDPAAELEETRAKAKGMLLALGKPRQQGAA